ncbi:MAG: hypothetical protein EON47_24685 [Acetobacteraceae bacterium]|nr:MAG: hypothetical protein EON47_24685 [Acetobacteraceae bacterium]
MFRNLLLASVIAVGAAGAAVAQEGPRLVGGNGNGGPEVVYGNGTGLPDNVVGSAQVRLSGGDRDRTYQYGRVNAFPGQVGRLVGGGADAYVAYEPVQHANGLASVETGAPRS